MLATKVHWLNSQLTEGNVVSQDRALSSPGGSGRDHPQDQVRIPDWHQTAHHAEISWSIMSGFIPYLVKNIITTVATFTVRDIHYFMHSTGLIYTVKIFHRSMG